MFQYLQVRSCQRVHQYFLEPYSKGCVSRLSRFTLMLIKTNKYPLIFLLIVMCSTYLQSLVKIQQFLTELSQAQGRSACISPQSVVWCNSTQFIFGSNTLYCFKNMPHVVRKTRLVNVYSFSKIQVDWKHIFERRSNGESVESLSREFNIPSSTIKTRYYKWKKDPSNGLEDNWY